MSAINLNRSLPAYIDLFAEKKSVDSESSLPSIVPASLFQNTVKKTTPLTVLKKIAGCIVNAETTSWINSLLGEARAVYGLVKTFFKNMILASRIFAATELSKTLSIPFDIQNLVLGIYDFIVEKGEGRIDAFLGMLGTISEIGDAVSSLVAMLSEIGALGASVMSWAGPLNLASCALSAVFIVMSVRSLYFSTQVIKKLNQQLTKPSTPNYRGAYKVFKEHTYELERHCGVDVKLAQNKVRTLFKEKQLAATKRDKADVDSKMGKVFKALKGRVHRKQFSHVLGILMTKLGILATILFAVSPFFAPLAIGGFCALAILFATCMFKMGYEFYANARFKGSIKAVPAA